MPDVIIPSSDSQTGPIPDAALVPFFDGGTPGSQAYSDVKADLQPDPTARQNAATAQADATAAANAAAAAAANASSALAAHTANAGAHHPPPSLSEFVRDLGAYDQLSDAEKRAVNRGDMTAVTHGGILNQLWLCWSPTLARTPRGPGDDNSGWRPVSGAVHDRGRVGRAAGERRHRARQRARLLRRDAGQLHRPTRSPRTATPASSRSGPTRRGCPRTRRRGPSGRSPRLWRTPTPCCPTCGASATTRDRVAPADFNAGVSDAHAHRAPPTLRTGAEPVALIDAALGGSTWQQGGGGSGVTPEQVAAAIASHAGQANVHHSTPTLRTGAQTVALINAELGGSTWQQGGGMSGGITADDLETWWGDFEITLTGSSAGLQWAGDSDEGTSRTARITPQSLGNIIGFIDGDDGDVLTKTGSGAVEWDAPSGGLPAATSADEGRIAKVQADGTWALGTDLTASPGSGTTIPFAVPRSVAGEVHLIRVAQKTATDARSFTVGGTLDGDDGGWGITATDAVDIRELLDDQDDWYWAKRTHSHTVRYDNILDRPIHRVSNEAAIPAPSASTLGRRYQTNAGREYIIERQLEAGVDRVLNFEAYPLTSDSYQGAVNNFGDISPGTLTTADEGKWWLIRDYLNQGTAPFVLVDTNANPQSIAHIPDAGYDYKGRYHSEGEAESDASIAATDAVIYPNSNGLDTLYRPDSTFVAGTPAHDVYVIVPTDVADALRARIDQLERRTVRLVGNEVETLYTNVGGTALTRAAGATNWSHAFNLDLGRELVEADDDHDIRIRGYYTQSAVRGAFDMTVRCAEFRAWTQFTTATATASGFPVGHIKFAISRGVAATPDLNSAWNRQGAIFRRGNSNGNHVLGIIIPAGDSNGGYRAISNCFVTVELVPPLSALSAELV